jgi:protein involved in polysaccharide export with SLBB domain
MSFIRQSFRRLACGLLTCFCLTVTAAEAQEPEAGGVFNTPGVPAATTTASGSTAQPQPGMPAGATNSSAQNATRATSRQGGQSQRRETPPRQLPPPPPSEFQRFVEAATGRLLPMFGARFFSESAGSMGSLDNVPVAADYVVGPGDELIIRAWGSIDVDYRATVDRNGQVNLPQVGSFNVSGVKASDLERHLRAQIGRLFTNFNLNVTLGQLRGVRVFVVGPAVRPGVYTLPSQSTLLSAVVAAGGPAPNGSMRKLSLRRDGRVISELDVYEFLVQGDKSKDVQLAAGDVVVFQSVGPRIALNGAIDNPAIYELRSPQEPVREVLRYAGGAPVLANPNRAQLERIDATQPRAARFVEDFRLDGNGLQKPLRDGDVLTLLAISPQFANAVTLKGHVAQPLRYVHTPGMRIRDLIPDKEALISPDFYRRKNLLVQVLEKDVAEQAKKPPAALFDELNWDYAVIERLSAQDLSTQVIPFNLGAAVLRGDPHHNLELMSGDVVTIYSQKDIRVPVARQTRLVAVEGEVGAPGVYQLLPGETLKSLMARAGGLTPQAYLYGMEFSREETRQRQRENLAAAIARLEAQAATRRARDAANRSDDESAASAMAASNAATEAQMARLSRIEPNGRIALELMPEVSTIDALPDVPLENADRIRVPSKPGFVTVAGAVVNDNALLWKPGRTAGDYVKLAGLDEAANPSNMFILRADGTVTHATDRSGLFGFGGLSSEQLNPGDAVIVPNQLDFETWGRALVRNLKDWSQIFSQFGLGAAAIKTLRED